jgi:hypothetical protein
MNHSEIFEEFKQSRFYREWQQSYPSVSGGRAIKRRLVAVAPSLAGALRDICREYRISIAATNGQCGGFLHTDRVEELLDPDSLKYQDLWINEYMVAMLFAPKRVNFLPE